MKKPIIITSSITTFLITVFISRKKISYPQGSPEGGKIAGIGVLVIILIVVALSFLIFQLLKENENKIK